MSNYLRRFWPLFVFLILIIGIFHKVFFAQLVPFPGDLLVSWFFPYKSGGWEGFSPWITHKEFIAADSVRQLYPWRELAMELIRGGVMPLWNPYAFSGTPLMANMQSAVFYPVNILFLLFTTKFAWVSYILLQPVLAFVFMYLFIRSLGLSKHAGLFSGFAYGFIGYTSIWFELGVVGHTVLWLPLVLWGINKFVKDRQVIYLFASVFGLTCSLLAGHAQSSVYVMIISFAYFLFLTIKHMPLHRLVSSLWIFILPLGIAAIQILPSLEFLQYSARDVSNSTEVFHRFQLPLEHLVTILAPDFFGNPAVGNFWGKDYGEFLGYIGVVAFSFAMIGLFIFWKEKTIRFFFFSGIIALLFALPTFLSDALLLLRIPILGTGIPARSLFVLAFALVVIAGYGVDALLQQKKKIFAPLIIILCLYGLLWGVVMLTPAIAPDAGFVSHLGIAKKNLVLPTAIFCAFFFLLFVSSRIRRSIPIIFFILLLFAGFEYYYFFSKFQPLAPASYMFPTHPLITYLAEKTPPTRVFGYDTARIETNLATNWRVLSPEGYDPLYIRRYGELIYASDKRRLTSMIPRSDALFANSLPIDDSYAKQVIMNIAGVSYVIDKDDNPTNTWDERPDRFPQDRYMLVWQQGKWKVYNNKKALPRATIFYNTAIAKNDKQLVNTLFDESFDYHSTVLLENDARELLYKNEEEAIPATISEYSANKVVIQANAKHDGLLFLSDAHYPGWKAFVDGKDTHIYRANYAFRGVPVSKGQHTISFVYDPKSFSIGKTITLLSLGIFVIFFSKTLLQYKKRSSKK